MARQTKTTARHPLRDPFQTTMLALALAGGAGGAASRTAAAAKAATPTRRALRKLTPEEMDLIASGGPAVRRLGRGKKTQETIKRTVGPAVKRRDRERAAGQYKDSPRLRNRERDVEKAISRTKKEAGPGPVKAFLKKPHYDRTVKKIGGGTYKRAASANPLVRGSRKLEQKFAYEPSRKRAEQVAAGKRKKGGAYSRSVQKRELVQRQRVTKQSQTKGEPTPNRAADPNRLQQALGIPMNMLRAGMILNPRYYAQNLGSTGAMLLAQQGPHGIARSLNTQRKLTPEDRQTIRASMGDPGTGAMAIEAAGPGSSLASRGMRWANVPEARMRELAWLAEARKRGVSSPDDISALLSKRGVDNDLFQMITRQGEEAAGAYSRLGNVERGVMRSQIPIFYPMWKALTRYTARFPAEHSIQAALLANLGQQGYEQQTEDFPGMEGEPALPPWLPYLIKTGEGRTANPQNVLPYSPGADVTEALLGFATPGGTSPTRTIGQYFAPGPEMLWAALTGQQIQTGWPVKGMGPGVRPIVPALKDFAPAMPLHNVLAALGVDPFEPYTTRTYGTPDKKAQWMNILFGPSYPRDTDFGELRRGARAERKRRTGR